MRRGLAEWRERDGRARRSLAAYALAATEPFEGRAVVELQRALPMGATIFAGNSMPVRDADAFLASGGRPLTVVANRGANGIDGVVSSALGARRRRKRPGRPPHRRPLPLPRPERPLGGNTPRSRPDDRPAEQRRQRIFHYLPQAEHGQVFEEWFGTPSGIDFAAAASAYGASHRLIGDWDELRGELGGGGVRIAEIRTDRARNRELHEAAWAAANEAAWA